MTPAAKNASVPSMQQHGHVQQISVTMLCQHFCFVRKCALVERTVQRDSVTPAYRIAPSTQAETASYMS
jgi:hypothetical protein